MPYKIQLKKSVAVGSHAASNRIGASAVRLPAVPPLQRMILPLGDLVSLGSRKKILSEEDVKSAKIISNAVGDRARATGEKIARTHEISGEQGPGGLSKIGLTEELRLFGHGEVTQLSGGEAVQIAGYTPSALAQLLIDMGLPENYQGEIYLSGCLTAIGNGYGFLGKFYQLIKSHCPGCLVRGNLGNTTTFSDGTQGVWSGIVTKEAYDKQMAEFKMMANEVIKGNETLEEDVRSGKITLKEARVRLAKSKDLLERIGISKEQYNRTIYDTTGAYTVLLPSGSLRAENAIKAIVKGAVTSPDDVNKLLERIDETNLQKAKETLNEAMVEMERDLSGLMERTSKL